MQRLTENWVGVTVSEDTLQPRDLLESFIPVLEEVVQHNPKEKKIRMLLKECQWALKGDKDDCELEDLLQEVFEVLNMCAPEGHYFGAHWGDAARFGFFKDEEKEEPVGLQDEFIFPKIGFTTKE